MKPSGLTWMGVIPTHWNICRIKEVAPFKTGKDYPKTQGGVPVIGSGSQPITYIDQSLEKKPALVIGRKGTIDRPYVVNVPFWPVDTCMFNTFEREGIKFQYACYAMMVHPWEQLSTKTALPSLAQSDVNRSEMLVPPYNEQIAIASFLDDRTSAIDRKIQLLEEKATALADMRKSVIHQAVTKGLDPNVAMKPSGVDWIGDVPGHWAVTRIKNVVSIVKGKKPHLLATNADTRAPYLSARVIRGTEEPQYAELSDSQSVMATANDILIIMDGSNSGEIFTNVAGVVSSTMGKLNYRSSVTKKMLMYFLDILFDTFNSEKVGAAIPHLDKDAFNKAEIVLPSICEQEAICSYLDVYVVMIDESIKTITEQIVTLKSLRQSLIHEAVTGKIDVADYGYNYE